MTLTVSRPPSKLAESLSNSPMAPSMICGAALTAFSAKVTAASTSDNTGWADTTSEPAVPKSFWNTSYVLGEAATWL